MQSAWPTLISALRSLAVLMSVFASMVCWCERCWADELAAPWERAYEGVEANGPQVIGLWKFDTDAGADAALAQDLKILAATWPTYFDPYLSEYLQVGRDGKPHPRKALTPNAPKVMQAFERAGASIAKTFADHPAFEGVLANSEIRDESEVSFSEWDLAANDQPGVWEVRVHELASGQHASKYVRVSK